MNTPSLQSKLGQSAFDAIAGLAHREFGLKIVPEKRPMVQSRLRHRLRALNMSDFDAYSRLVCSTQGADERRSMISALTTNVSHFFREPHHFDLLTEVLLPTLPARIQAGERIRIWSAGCSNGQEPYSIAMHLLCAAPKLATADFKILATDIDPNVIAFAKNGHYLGQLTAGVPETFKAQFMQSDRDELRVGDVLRRCVVFQELNLMSEWPMRHPFDAIFCRNVVIYFDTATQERLWPRFHAALKNDGIFFLGHSERVAAPARFGFKTIGTTAYTRGVAPVRQSVTQSGGLHGAS